jgi:hypothetical protein
MPIVTGEIKLYRSQNVSDTPASNGGRIGTAEIVTNVNNNIFADVSQSERVAGSTKWRKAFFRNLNSSDLALQNPRIFLENYTPAQDNVSFIAGSQTNNQSDLTGSEKIYGGGKLDASVSAAATQVTVLIESAAVQPFANGDKIRISDKANIGAGGNEEYVTISGTPGLVGTVVTINFTPALQNAFSATNTRVANVYEPGSITGSQASVVATTVGDGDFDETTYPITVPNVGGVYDNWTLTFTGPTSFTCAGTREGSIAGTGSTLAGYSPNNPATGTPYFTVPSAGWTGTWQAGDTLTFITNPASVPVWVRRIVPAGAAAYSGNKAILAIDGETS